MLISLLLTLLTLHDIHVSRSEINYDSQTKTMQVAVQLFADDLELWASRNTKFKDLNIATDTESSETDQFISQYLEAHFRLLKDGKQIPLTFLGKESTDDYYGIWVYLESEALPMDGKLELENTILLDQFRDQQNMTSFTRDKSSEKYFIFRGDKERVKLFG